MKANVGVSSCKENSFAYRGVRLHPPPEVDEATTPVRRCASEPFRKDDVFSTNRILLVALLSLALSRMAIAADSPRQVIDLNPGWKFIRQDVPGAEQNAFDDSKWDAINLPHTWNNMDGEDGGNNYHRGIGWYRLHLKTDPAWNGKEIYIKFDAASINTTVFVNGKPAGKHAGCFGAFCFDITPRLNHDGDNVIAVQVSNKHDENVAPLSGDFTVFGGIYRNVHLLVLNPLSISPIDDASSGVYVRQDKVDADQAALHVTAVVTPTYSTPERNFANLRFELIDAAGKVASFGRGLVDATATNFLIQTDLKVAHPHLWNARKDPYLYELRASVVDGDRVLDVVEQPIGLRSYHVDPEKGFILNGQPYRLYGVNRHQDHLDEGWAVSLADHQLDFANMMEMGCTGVRLSHYQHAQEFYDLCDRGGMVAWAELPLVNQVNDTPEFEANASQQLRELIKQNYNHPSICFWSLSNEQSGGKNHPVDLLTKLNKEAHELDPTRLTTQASDQQPGKPQDAITDVIAFNRYHGWYGGKPDGLGPDLDKIHNVYPDRAVGISEFGAGASIHQHEADVKQPKAGGKWHPEEWQCVVHEAAWAAIKPRPWIWGAFLWCEHGFAADQRNEGDHAGRNDKGLTTYDGKTKKDAFYFYKANWNPDPMVYITERRFTPRPVADAPVKVYSNCESVVLMLNGVLIGPAKGSDIDVFLFPKVKLQPGENRLEAIGTRGGKQCVDSCSIVFDVNATDGRPPATRPATHSAH
jgi:beta-galactosidase